LETTATINIESESLSFHGDKTISIPPRTSKPVTLEYVAREENVNYRREVLIFNDFNKLEVVAKAKNVDNHQVLLHSQLYKIRTYNSKRVLQIQFEKCLLNLPNVRMFSIQNLYSRPLVFHIQPVECLDVSIYRIDDGDKLPTDSTPDPFADLLLSPSPPFSLSQIAGMSTNASIANEDLGRAQSGTNKHTTAKFSKDTALDTIHIAASNEFPFNIVNTSMDVEDAAAGPETATSVTQSKQVSAIRQHYTCLRESIALNNGLIPLQESYNGHFMQGVVSIPVNSRVTFVVVFEPRQTEAAQSSVKQRDSKGNEALQRQIQVRILNLTYGDARRHLQQGLDQAEQSMIQPNEIQSPISERQQLLLQQPLKYRLLLVRAKVYRSVLTVLQRNINFGHALVGSIDQTSVTIVNRSVISKCMFALSKSRSFSSGFLSIMGESRGILDPNTSRTLDFLFKPSLQGPFEETVVIENVLDPENNHSVLFKANVTKPDKFEIKLVGKNNSDNKQAVLLQGVVNSSAEIDNTEVLEKIADPATIELASQLEIMLKQEVAASPSAFGPVFMPSVAMASNFTPGPSITFRLRNISSKKRVFVVDIGHKDVFAKVSLTAAEEQKVGFEESLAFATIRCYFAEVPKSAWIK
jgi:hypothetical protein